MTAYPTRLRATVEFADDVADAVQEWPNAYRDEADATAWGEIMERLTKGAIFKDLEQFCDDCGKWETLTNCASCHFPTCEKAAASRSEFFEDAICEDCAEDEGPGDCLAPSGPQGSTCHCPNH